MDLAIYLIGFPVLIVCVAFFSANEFAIAKIRVSRIDQLVESGHKNALAAKQIVANIDDYLFACQIGVAISVLGLGWMGHAMIVKMIQPLMDLSTDAATLFAFAISFLSVAFILVILGELMPKTIAVQKSESITLFSAKPLIWSYRIFAILIWFLKKAADLIADLFGMKRIPQAAFGHTEEELKSLVADSFHNGGISPFKHAYVNKIFEFDQLLAREIMVPRTEMRTLEKDMTLKEVFSLADVEQFTRYPVTDGDKDHIIGLVNMKYLLTAYVRDASNGDLPVILYMQPVIQVLGSVPVSDLLLKIQQEQIHMAILRDEYGGTFGLVTIEDIIEEIVGDIRDEFDMDEIPEVQKLSEHHYIFDAKMRIDRVNVLLGIDINDEDIDTIGGWFMSKSFDTIEEQAIFEQGYEFLAKDMKGHHIHYLEVHKLANSEHNST